MSSCEYLTSGSEFLSLLQYLNNTNENVDLDCSFKCVLVVEPGCLRREFFSLNIAMFGVVAKMFEERKYFLNIAMQCLGWLLNQNVWGEKICFWTLQCLGWLLNIVMQCLGRENTFCQAPQHWVSNVSGGTSTSFINGERVWGFCSVVASCLLSFYNFYVFTYFSLSILQLLHFGSLTILSSPFPDF